MNWTFLLYDIPWEKMIKCLFYPNKSMTTDQENDPAEV